MSLIRVTGATVGGNGVILYLEGGNTQSLKATDYRTRDIVDRLMENGGTAEIDLAEFSLAAKIAKVTNGAIQIKETVDGLSVQTKHGELKNASALRKHVERAALSKNIKALAAFMRHFADIKREHSAEELLTFMEQADLPIADDGSLIAYKILRKTDVEGVYVDPHTETVKQRVGSLVYMPGKVNEDRRQACGTGLHVCSHGYISGFWRSGAVLTLIKVPPQAVVAVPYNERTKMRAASYLICALLSDDAAQGLSEGKPIEDFPRAMQILANVIAGNHSGAIERVEVGSVPKSDKSHIKITLLDVKANRPRRVRKVREVLLSAPKTKLITPAEVRRRMKAAGSRDNAYVEKLRAAQAAYDAGMSIRNIAKKYGMDRESLGKNLIR